MAKQPRHTSIQSKQEHSKTLSMSDTELGIAAFLFIFIIPLWLVWIIIQTIYELIRARQGE